MYKLNINNSIRDLEYYILSKSAYSKDIVYEKKVKIDEKKEVWKLIDSKTHKSGLHAVAYKKDNNIVIAYRGTDPTSVRDIFTDGYYIAGQFSPFNGRENQFVEGLKFAEEIKRKNPNANISSTGHSLGAGVSHFSSAILGLDSVTFAGAAIINSLPDKYKEAAKEGKFDNTHVNYILPEDPVGGGYKDPWTNKRSYIGTTYVIGVRCHIRWQCFLLF
ncbi:alpha/beta hydrolase family protein [Bacillus massilinigeriensis]|uniref:hypothetical protein n=1 Tax=Bacillus mediterraneensis TaxID=1805474 RepID=UPI0008F8A7E3|nr:hypothetical protein [Bacillus mediterraneensis]